MKGVLCSHIIKILRNALNIKEIPTQYILIKWTKQARVKCVQDMHGSEIQEDPKLQQTCRYRSLCSIFTRISSTASESEKTYILANENAINLTKLVEDILHLETVGDKHEKDDGSQNIAIEVNCTQDSNVVKVKGLKKKETSRGRCRIKSGLEKALAKRKTQTKPHEFNIASTSMPWTTSEQSQQTSFQELLQQHCGGFSFVFQDSQASNN
ncbi:hypothetical protein Dsin_028199 [Dipteronia sinensis]|uniref:Protein FAR1-RELATED SEQUENCE n=1 Tax=Dipteronia sinensis TaxID=43782 RepID=A0AAD9ZPX3_9ROSI|nr:hypothetical protein Dsin_028199 [Dipteronia sinensis]